MYDSETIKKLHPELTEVNFKKNVLKKRPPRKGKIKPPENMVYKINLLFVIRTVKAILKFIRKQRHDVHKTKDSSSPVKTDNC